VLRSGPLRAAGGALTEAQLEAAVATAAAGVAGGKAFFEGTQLKVVSGGGAACIVLAEEDGEFAAPEAGIGQERAGDAGGAVGEAGGSSQPLSLVPGSQSLPSLISRADASHVFGEDDLAHTKLTLLTSTSADAKIEALRRLWLSPIAIADKAALFLMALRDSAAGVRAEAARGLGALGLDSRVAENLARACTGTPEERLVAVANLRHVLAGNAAGGTSSHGRGGAAAFGERESALTVAVLTGLVSGGEDRALAGAALTALEELLPPRAAAFPELLAQLHARVQELLLVQRADLLQVIRRLYLALFEAHREPVAAMLRASLAEVAPRHLRSFFLSLLLSSRTAAATDPEVLRLAVNTLLDSDELDPSHLPLENSLREIGESVLPVLLEVFRAGPEGRQARMMAPLSDLLRTTAADAPAHTSAGDAGDSALTLRDLTAAALLDAFERGSASLRNALYESGLLRPEVIPGGMVARAARLLLSDVHEHELETSRDVVSGAILQLGGAAFAPVLDAAATSTRDLTIEVSCDLVVLMVDRWGDVPEVSGAVEGALERLWPMLEAPSFPARGALCRATGRLAAHRAVSQQRASEIARALLERAKSSSSAYDIIDGLGYLAGGDSISAADRLDLCHVLLGFLQLDLPKLSGRMRKSQEDMILDFGRETTAYTDLIPRLLTALGRVISRDDVQLGLWRHIVDVLTGLWNKVARYEIIWAPASTLALAQMLGRAAASRMADARLREDITEMLLLKAGVVPVIQVLGRVCMTEATPRMDLLAARVFERLDKLVSGAEDIDPSEKREVLRSLAGLLERANIGDDPELDRRTRRRILDHLYGALKSRTPGVLDMLKGIAANEKIAVEDREEVRLALGRTRG
jgi:hypothetical protein